MPQNDGDKRITSEELFKVLYEVLRRRARHRMSNEPAGSTLQPTALLNEAFVRLNSKTWNSREQFISAVANTMRHILVDHARRKSRKKRGGGAKRFDLRAEDTVIEDPEAIVELNEVLDRFQQVHPQKAKFVELRYFAGLSGKEAAAVLGISPNTAGRWWQFSRAWLKQQLCDESSD